MRPQLAEQATAYRILKQDLIEHHGFGEDDQALLDTLEGATDLVEQLVAMLRFAREKQKWATANEIEIETLRARNASIKDKAERAIAKVVSTMDLVGLKRIEVAGFGYTLARGRQELVGDCNIEELSERYVRVKREVNRAEIRAALKNGEHVAGFSLSNGQPHLRALP